MAIFYQLNYQIRTAPNPANPAQQISSAQIGPHALFAGGVMMDMAVALDSVTAQSLHSIGQSIPTPIAVKALLDTGCTVTSVDQSIINRLGLKVRGYTTTHTAAGPQIVGQYVAALSFPGTALQGKILHQVQSVNLSGQPFQILIGRDLMSSWSITYNGPAGFISIAD